MSRTWILVAESSRAKLYAANGNLAPLSELEDLVHPAGRMHEGDLVADRAGSDGGSIGQGRHVIDDKTSAREQEKLEFARQLARDNYDLILVARRREFLPFARILARHADAALERSGPGRGKR